MSVTQIRGIAPITNKRVGRIVALERRSRHLTLAELGTRIGVDHSTLAGWEQGRRPIPKKHVTTLCEHLDIEPALIDPEAA
jgi:transcriptional regulator with XRE-family HTH domain